MSSNRHTNIVQNTLLGFGIVLTLTTASFAQNLLISEVDSDQTSSDTTEFIELSGDPSTSLTGYIVVLYNGSNDLSYLTVDLTGFSTDVNGRFVIGSTGQAGADIQIAPGASGWLQNGQDAVAVYQAAAASFPNGTPVTATNLVDALVYDTSDADDLGLLAALTPGQPQIDENGLGTGVTVSMQRCSGGALVTTGFALANPTIDAANDCNLVPGACCTGVDTCDEVTQIACQGLNGLFQGLGTDCTPNPCGPTGSCCDTTSFLCDPFLTEDECTVNFPGRTWTEAGDCIDCNVVGSCCLMDGSCISGVTQARCAADRGRNWIEGDDCSGQSCAPAVPAPIIISEYYESAPGSRKALEIYNVSNQTVDLYGHSVVVFSNLTSAFPGSSTIRLDDLSLTANEVIVIKNADAITGYAGPAAITSGNVNFNGDDAVALVFGDHDPVVPLTPLVEPYIIDSFAVPGQEDGGPRGSNPYNDAAWERDCSVAGGVQAFDPCNFDGQKACGAPGCPPGTNPANTCTDGTYAGQWNFEGLNPADNGLHTLGVHTCAALDPVGACCVTTTCTVETQADCDTLSGTWTPGQGCEPNLCGGACCDGLGGCTLTVDDAACTGTFQGIGSTCSPVNPCALGACCLVNRDPGSCANDFTEADCTAMSGFYQGIGTTCTDADPCGSLAAIKINEIRIDQTATDLSEYFELANNSNRIQYLDGLTYFVIGDSSALLGNSGLIDGASALQQFGLDGFNIEPNGHFLAAANTTFALSGTPDVIIGLGDYFENSDNVTHMLVSGFTGFGGQDLDAEPDDCLIDAGFPWGAEVDRVCVVEVPLIGGVEPATSGDECYYSLGGDTIGPDGTFAPGHVYRFPDKTGPWKIGPFEPINGDDTPGAENVIPEGACCVDDSATTEPLNDCHVMTRDDCTAAGGTYQGNGTNCTINVCIGACCITTPTPGCEDITLQECTDLSGTFVGGGTSCITNPCNVPCLDVEDLRAATDGTNVIETCEVIVNSKWDTTFGGNTTISVQDASGTDLSGPGGAARGITIIEFHGVGDPPTRLVSIDEGDRLVIRGADLGTFSSLKQLQLGVGDLVDNNGDGPVPTPAVVTAADFANGSTTAENLESVLVQINCVAFITNVGLDFDGGLNYTVIDAAGTSITVRVPTDDNDLVGNGVNVPEGPINLKGIFSQNSAVANQGYQLLITRPDDIITPATGCGDQGACCNEVLGICFDAPQAICQAYEYTFTTGANCATLDPPCVAATGACCLDTNTYAQCENNHTFDSCFNLAGVFLGIGSLCDGCNCPDARNVWISEVRIDQAGTDFDEYFELRGPPFAPLEGLTYVVIGDGTGASGVVERSLSLSGLVIPADGVFLAVARAEYSLGGDVDYLIGISDLFENSDNLTHLLIKGTAPAVNTDLDVGDDCVLDAPPWSLVIDRVALIESNNPPVGTECHYGLPGELVGPVALNAGPFHAINCRESYADPSDWRVGSTEPGDLSDPTISDSPGVPNPCDCDCNGDLDNSEAVDIEDVDEFVDEIIAGGPGSAGDMNCDGERDGKDIQPMIDAVLANDVVCATGGGPSPTQIEPCGGANPACDTLACLYDVTDAGTCGCLGLFEGATVCVSCPGAGVCPTGEQTFEVVNYDGFGGVCTFTATLNESSPVCSEGCSGNANFNRIVPAR